MRRILIIGSGVMGRKLFELLKSGYAVELSSIQNFLTPESSANSDLVILATALAAHAEYLQGQLEELKEFVEYQDKRLIGVEQNEVSR